MVWALTMKLARACLLLPAFSVLVAESTRDPLAEPPVRLPPVVVSSTSLEVGVQLNPFANFFTKRLKYINVSRLKEGSVAARAGLRNGDRIIEICGRRLADYRITDFPDIELATVDHQVAVRMKVQRKGVPTAVEITMVFAGFDGQFEWSIRHSTLQKRALPADDWPLESSNPTKSR